MALINRLNGNSDIVNEDSNSNSISEKPSVDTGQTDSNSSKIVQDNSDTNPPTEADESSLSNDKSETNACAPKSLKLKLNTASNATSQKCNDGDENEESDIDEDKESEDDLEEAEDTNGRTEEKIPQVVPSLKIKPIPDLKKIGTADVKKSVGF